jgi:hypothetical protein
MGFAFFQVTTSGLIVALKLAYQAKKSEQGNLPQGLD